MGHIIILRGVVGVVGALGGKLRLWCRVLMGGRAMLSGKPSTFDQDRDEDEVVDQDKKYQKLKQPS